MKPEVYWIYKIAPHKIAFMPRPRSGDWLEEEIAGWHQEGIDWVISLLENREVYGLGLEREEMICQREGISFISFPIVDRGVPTSMGETTILVKKLLVQIKSGVGVAVHCRAGIGRSGLITACVLLGLGMKFSEVFAMLSEARGLQVPDTQLQMDWVERFSKTIESSL